jgi:hypothetical protein
VDHHLRWRDPVHPRSPPSREPGELMYLVIKINHEDTADLTPGDLSSMIQMIMDRPDVHLEVRGWPFEAKVIQASVNYPS